MHLKWKKENKLNVCGRKLTLNNPRLWVRHTFSMHAHHPFKSENIKVKKCWLNG